MSTFVSLPPSRKRLGDWDHERMVCFSMTVMKSQKFLDNFEPLGTAHCKGFHAYSTEQQVYQWHGTLKHVSGLDCWLQAQEQHHVAQWEEFQQFYTKNGKRKNTVLSNRMEQTMI